MKKINLRGFAAEILEDVLEKKHALSVLLPIKQSALNAKDRALLQEICFGVLRVLPKLEELIQLLMPRPMQRTCPQIHYLIMVGLYQLIYTRIPPHAALSETVEGAVQLKYPRLKGVVNGVLRQFQRKQNQLVPQLQPKDQHHFHPMWLLRRLQEAWPAQWEQIVEANNQRPPLWLRVNRQYHTTESWRRELRKTGQDAIQHDCFPDAVKLEKPAPVGLLPGFEEGWVTVQDASAQASVLFLDPQNNENILDLCAAPGGKTTYLLEIAPEARVMAVDIDQQRLKKVHENLQRLGLRADVRQGDGRFPKQWCGDKQFDRILLDAPCSSTGVIRRHPDIKWLRQEDDILTLTQLQQDMLDAIWPHLKPGGTLLYATCSVLPEENHLQIAHFLARHRDAYPVPLSNNLDAQLQLFPDPQGGDGFFYAKLAKKVAQT